MWWRRFLLSGFCGLLLVLGVFSTPTNALTLTIGVKPTGVEYANPEVQCSGPLYDEGWWDATIGNRSYCEITPSGSSTTNTELPLRGIRTKNSYAVEEGKYYTIYLETRNNSGSVGNSSPMLWTVQPSPSDYFSLVGLSTEYDQTGLTDNFNGPIIDQWYSNMYAITIKALKSGTTRFQLGNTTQILVMSRLATVTGEYKFQTRINRIVEYDPDTSTEDAMNNAFENNRETEQEEIQNASDEAENGANEAGDGAEQATQSLLDTITSIIGAITTAQPTNCNISLNITGRFNAGNLNLCNAPNEIRNVISVFILVPLTLGVLHLAYSLISQYLDRIRKEQE